MNNELKYGIRNSRMLLNEVYFWTDTIKDWNHLLKETTYKNIILDCWRELVYRRKIKIYGFVIMPNHLHVLWEMLEHNGKEMPHASFNKFTSHQFLKILKELPTNSSNQYRVNDQERNHLFWQRDALAIQMNYKTKLEQKLDYIHLNPLQEQWNLATKPENYLWSSAGFYENGVDNFGFLTHYQERF